MWKTLLACWGGIRDYTRVKQLARELAGLPLITQCSKFYFNDDHWDQADYQLRQGTQDHRSGRRAISI